MNTPLAKALIKSVISANRLADGVVVFIGRDGGWVEALQNARQFAHAEEAEQKLIAARMDEAANIVVDSYAFNVRCEGHTITPVTLRDAIRAQGPTIDYAPARPQN